jgi:hypothetical protein
MPDLPRNLRAGPVAGVRPALQGAEMTKETIEIDDNEAVLTLYHKDAVVSIFVQLDSDPTTWERDLVDLAATALDYMNGHS